jgi:hypothetical protein
MTGSQYNTHEGNSWANRVKHASDKAALDIQSRKYAVLPFKNAEELQIAVHQSRPSEQYANDEQDPMIVEDLPCSPADKAPSHPKAVNKSDNNTHAIFDEGNPVTSDTQETYTKVPKWSDLLTTDSETERDLEKQGKKREKSTKPKDDVQKGNESDDNTIDAGPSQLTKTPSPKRPKKKSNWTGTPQHHVKEPEV